MTVKPFLNNIFISLLEMLTGTHIFFLIDPEIFDSETRLSNNPEKPMQFSSKTLYFPPEKSSLKLRNH